jgi:hypothetical protein
MLCCVVLSRVCRQLQTNLPLTPSALFFCLPLAYLYLLTQSDEIDLITPIQTDQLQLIVICRRYIVVWLC